MRFNPAAVALGGAALEADALETDTLEADTLDAILLADEEAAEAPVKILSVADTVVDASEAALSVAEVETVAFPPRLDSGLSAVLLALAVASGALPVAVT